MSDSVILKGEVKNVRPASVVKELVGSKCSWVVFKDAEFKEGLE